MFGPLQCTLRSTLKDILWVDLAATMPTDHGKEREPILLDRVPNGCRRCAVLLHVHMLLRSAAPLKAEMPAAQTPLRNIVRFEGKRRHTRERRTRGAATAT